MAFLKKWGLKIILPCALALVALVVLLVCFCGLRGVYVCVDDPSLVLSFGVSDVDVVYDETVLEGTYKQSGRVLELSIELPPSVTGGTSDGILGARQTYDHRALVEKVDGYDKISVGGRVFERVSLIKLRDNVKKVDVKFDLGGVEPETFENDNPSSVAMGGFVELPELIAPEDDVFLGWFTAPYGSEDAEEATVEGVRIWKDTVFYAWWQSQAAEDVPDDGGGTETPGGEEVLPGA